MRTYKAVTKFFERIFSGVYFQHVRTGGEGGIRTRIALRRHGSYAITRTHANEYIKQVKEKYLVSQIQPGASLVGYVDLNLEDVHSGPFTLRVPVGDKTYNFVFGPESLALEFPPGS